VVFLSVPNCRVYREWRVTPPGQWFGLEECSAAPADEVFMEGKHRPYRLGEPWEWRWTPNKTELLKLQRPPMEIVEGRDDSGHQLTRVIGGEDPVDPQTGLAWVPMFYGARTPPIVRDVKGASMDDAEPRDARLLESWIQVGREFYRHPSRQLYAVFCETDPQDPSDEDRMILVVPPGTPVSSRVRRRWSTDPAILCIYRQGRDAEIGYWQSGERTPDFVPLSARLQILPDFLKPWIWPS
jgi:hypothetical protein